MATTYRPLRSSDFTRPLPARRGRWWLPVSAALTFGLLAVAGFGSLGCEQRGQSQEVKPALPRVGILPEGAPKPNIVLILQDALRADRLGAYGNPSGLSPTIDAIAAQGVTFEYCVSAAPWTVPSVASLFVGYYPSVHKATNYRVVAKEGGKKKVGSQSILSDQFTTLAEVLQADGYQTAGFCANRLVWPRVGFAQGFDHFDASFAGTTVRGALLNRALFNWLAERCEPEKPLFLYLHYMDVHGPYDAAPRFMDPRMRQMAALPNIHKLTEAEWKELTRFPHSPPTRVTNPTRFERQKRFREYWVARYEAGVAEGDFYLGQLVEGLKTLGLWQSAYVIFLADHGEALCEHGLWEHGYSQHQTDLHVPLILRWPNVLPAGMRVRRLASLIDVLPTLLEQLRLSPADDCQGVSLIDHISGTLPDSPLVRFAEAGHRSDYALFKDHLKLILTVPPGQELPDGAARAGSAPAQLYDLAEDPGELSNLASQRSGTVTQLVRLMDETMRVNRNTRPEIVPEELPIRDEIMRQLRALGYVGGDQAEEEEVP